jgi:hypothetical protein
MLHTAPYFGRRMPRAPASVLAAIVDYILRLKMRVEGASRSNLQLEWMFMEDARLDSGFASTPQPVTDVTHGLRSPQFLRWRFAEVPGKKFEFVAVKRSDGSPFGWWIVERRPGLLHVCDCSLSLMTAADAHRAWLQLAVAAERTGASTLSFECFAPRDYRETLQKAGMVARSSRPVFGEARDEADRGAAWFLTDADEDE